MNVKCLFLGIMATLMFSLHAYSHACDSLRVRLLAIFDEDQHSRAQSDSIRKAFGPQSAEMKTHDRLIGEKDSLNLIQVTNILDVYGWLGKDKVGEKANMALFLVIQHADIGTQQHYLPMMRDAVKKKNADPDQLAFLEDRVALRTGKKQLYGTQIRRDPLTGKFSLFPLDDPENADRRRAEVGLKPLKEYLRQWNIAWPAAMDSLHLP